MEDCDLDTFIGFPLSCDINIYDYIRYEFKSFEIRNDLVKIVKQLIDKPFEIRR